MKLTIHPDPQEPAGGFAFLELPGGTLGNEPVQVAVMEVYGSRWLGPSEEPGDKVAVGNANWQGERFDFGPYAVHDHDGADWVRIGPEIVNKIDEYTPLRLTVGGQLGDATWPDDVPPRAGAAVLGGLQPTARAAPQQADAELVGVPPEPEPAPEPPEVTPEPDPPATPKKRSLWWLLLILALAAGGVAIWYFYLREDTAVASGDTPVPSEETCTRAALVALDGFEATELAIRACGDALSADTVLKIIEDAARADDPGALLLFGTLYDGAELDARIETLIGLSFDHDAAKAAEYYARARAAGSDEARDRLAATCAQLARADETLAKGAYDDFCR
jgi:hypothetical protein